jgi:hypothetical protein
MKTRCGLCGGRKDAAASHCGAICALLAKNGRTGGWSREHLFPPEEEKAIRDAYKRGLSTPTLAKQHDTSPETIRSVLLRGKIRLRTRAESKRLTVNARKASLEGVNRRNSARRERHQRVAAAAVCIRPVLVPIIALMLPPAEVPVLVVTQPSLDSRARLLASVSGAASRSPASSVSVSPAKSPASKSTNHLSIT